MNLGAGGIRGTGVCLIAAAAILCAAPGCDTEEGYYDHVPPAGKGSLVIDNNTADDITVFLNGTNTASVGDGNERIFDLSPGVYRVVLDEEHGSQDYREDVDILSDRLTIMHVSPGLGHDEYNVDVEFD